MKDYDPQNHHTSCTGMLTIYMDNWQKLPVDGFRCKKKRSKFIAKFIES